MSAPKDRARRIAALSASAFLVSLPFPALALFSGRIEPGYSLIQTVTDDHDVHLETLSQVLTQSYRLQLDESLLPYLTFQGGGTFDDQHEWATTSPSAALARSESDLYAASAFADFTLGSPFLSSVAGYRWRETSQTSSLVETRALVDYHDLHFTGAWRPIELPSITLNLGRLYTTDHGRGLDDRVNDTLQALARYHAFAPLDVRYSASLLRLEDRAGGFEQRSVVHNASASYTDSFFDKRATVYLGYNFTAQSTAIDASNARGTVAKQQVAVGGYSTIETFPALPVMDTLAQNVALADGDLDTGAGIDLGFGPQLAGDSALRDLGGQFTDPFPDVNRIYVVVDRTLSSTVARGLSWEAYKSDDNLNWTAVALSVAPNGVPFDAVNHRFEVPIERTAARYLKVVTRPLATTITADPRYSRIEVTEVQFFLVLGVADAAAANTSPIANVVNASLTVRLLKSENLTYDCSLLLTNVQDTSSRTVYYLTNGLGYRKTLLPGLAINARASRQDSDLGGTAGRQGAFLHGAGVAFDPLPTLSHRLLYSGEVRQLPAGTSFSNALSLVNRATLYKGVVVGATAGGDLGENELGATRRGFNVMVTADLEPHPMLSLNGTFLHGYAQLAPTAATGATPTETTDAITQERASGGFSFHPLSTLYLTGALTWSRRSGAADRLLAAYGLNFSPLPGGSLQLDLAYSESDEVELRGTSRLFSSNVRWNIRTDILFVLGYTFSEARSEGLGNVSNAVFSKLTVSI